MTRGGPRRTTDVVVYHIYREAWQRFELDGERFSVGRGGEARIRISEVPAGAYSVYLYVWEDNDPQTFDISLSGQVVAKGYNSGNGGHWDRLGPWPCQNEVHEPV